MASSSAPAAVADQPSPRSGRHPHNPPPSASASSPPWSHVVRGDPEGVIPSAELPPSAEANIGDADQTLLSDGQGDGASAAPAVSAYGKKPAWRRPANGVVDAGPVVMGAVSWPALSESAKASPKSSQPLSAAPDAPKPIADGTILPVPAAPPKTSNSTLNHTTTVLQKSIKRGGGVGSSGIAGTPTNGGAAQKAQPSPASPGVAIGKQVAGPEVSPRERPGKGNNNWDHGSRGSGGDHQRGYRRGNNGGTGSNQNSNYGNRRDHERGSFDSYNRGRDFHMQHRGPRPYNIPPLPLAPPFMSLPPHARPFLNPVGYPDLPSPVVYIAPPPPESFRGFPFAQPPAPPPAFFPAIDTQRSMLLNQIDYYFSNENLCKDLFLRKNMDEQGWVPLSLVAGFNRGEKIRKRDDWIKWILNQNSSQFAALSGPQSPTNPISDSLTDHLQTMGLGESANQTSMPVPPDTSSNFGKQLGAAGDIIRELNGQVAGHTDSDQIKDS